jgi:hypothetical protein
LSTVTVSDIQEFARRVERLCDFLLEGVEKDGSDDVVEIQEIKKNAADLQFIKGSVSIEGLSNYMRGIVKSE